jgi:hypothetical protein
MVHIESDNSFVIMPKLDIGLLKLKKMLLEIHKARYCLVLPTTNPDKVCPPLKTPYNAHNIHIQCYLLLSPLFIWWPSSSLTLPSRQQRSHRRS